MEFIKRIKLSNKTHARDMLEMTLQSAIISIKQFYKTQTITKKNTKIKLSFPFPEKFKWLFSMFMQ